MRLPTMPEGRCGNNVHLGGQLAVEEARSGAAEPAQVLK